MPRRRGPARRHAAVRNKTAREYQSMVAALHALERTFTAPAVRRERTWRRRTRRDLAIVVGLLQEHCDSTEEPGGLLLEVEQRVGRFRDVSQARREHKRLVREAVVLLAELDEYAQAVRLPYHDFRKRAARLTGALRLHQAREADILMLAFQLDLGGGD